MTVASFTADDLRAEIERQRAIAREAAERAETAASDRDRASFREQARAYAEHADRLERALAALGVRA